MLDVNQLLPVDRKCLKVMQESSSIHQHFREMGRFLLLNLIVPVQGSFE